MDVINDNSSKKEHVTSNAVDEIKILIKNNCSPRHIPAFIMQVKDIPYTINGKKIEIAIKHIIHNKEVLLAFISMPEENNKQLRGKDLIDYVLIKNLPMRYKNHIVKHGYSSGESIDTGNRNCFS